MRLRPEQIQAGKTYKLVARHAVIKPIHIKVEDIVGDNIIVMSQGKLKEFSLKRFADLAVAEVGVS